MTFTLGVEGGKKVVHWGWGSELFPGLKKGVNRPPMKRYQRKGRRGIVAARRGEAACGIKCLKGKDCL